ncbi:MAG: flagellar biosynthesis protein FlhA [Thermaerobacter sp.]|jgi:flagellar biosynthesis protein FlhA|nr:flagellar biosynthesis protein FlhA [Thermaerobacter sp.]
MRERYLYGELGVAILVVILVGMLVIPVPYQVLDILIPFNISFALLVLLVTMYARDALEFSVFPSLLLITTLLRLALNVSATRLILLYAMAGYVIQGFGQFVVGGNPLVGFIIFVILVVIQFIVVTRGAERVSEVAARFTLDAMPGKQMAIDADLNAGLITDKEARQRRQDIEREADFYGAMDGASKFVRGDAIAGIVIVVVNILGGFVVGVAEHHMSLTTALSTYTILTVGDGLVSQIPALLLSTATGIIVTRAAADTNLPRDLTRQVLSQPRVLLIAGGALVVFGLMPGLNKTWWTFALLAGGYFLLSRAVARGRQQEAAQVTQQTRQQEAEAARRPENVTALLPLDVLELDLGYGLLSLADASQGGDLLDRVAMIRRQVALELGLVVPPIRIRDDLSLKPSTYCIKLRGVEVARGELLLGHLLAMNPGNVTEPVEGIAAQEPVFGLMALWITPEDRSRAEVAGYTVVDSPAVVATHLTEVIRSHAAELLGRQETQNLLDMVKKEHPAVVEELVPGLLTLGEVAKVLQNLLRERVAIRDLVRILETLADQARVSRDPDRLTEAVRQALGAQLCRQYGLDRDKAAVITLAPETEQAILGSVQEGQLALAPDFVGRLSRALSDEAAKLAGRGAEPVVLCAPLVRLYLRRLTERSLPRLIFLSYNEVATCGEVEAVGMVSVA